MADYRMEKDAYVNPQVDVFREEFFRSADIDSPRHTGHTGVVRDLIMHTSRPPNCAIA